MLTEDQLRDLLNRAGTTVEVDATPRPFTATPSRPRRPALAALLVVATVAGIGGLGLWMTDGGDGASVDGAAPVVLGGVPDGTVPSVFAHTRESATELLRGMGLGVDYREEISCDPAGRPLGTDPEVGTDIEPGATVTLLLAYQGSTTDCFSDLDEPWQFMDFATRRGPAPRFADQVTLVVDGRRATTLSGERAALGEWGDPSALTELRAAAGEVIRTGNEYQTPTLQARSGTPPAEFCAIPRPAILGDREALTITIDVTAGDQRDCPARVSVYRSDGGIDTVVAWTARSLASTPPDQRPVPDVVGLTLTEARDAVTAAGFTARVEELETCTPRQGVVEQAPTQKALDQDARDEPTWSGVVTLVIEIPHTRRDCAGLDAAAAGFIRFASGGPPPAWSPQVQHLFGYALRDKITAEQADDPSAWSFCSGVEPTECQVSALVVAGRGSVETGESRERYECELVDYGGLPSGLNSEDQIILFPADPSDCAADWSVELWIDRGGRITAVNLLINEAAVEAG